MLDTAKRLWTGCALLLLNTLVVFALANLVAAAILSWLPPADIPPALSDEEIAQVYPGKSSEDVRQLLEETWGRRYAYETFTEFKEGTTSGRFVTVEDTGFRRSPEDYPWPPAPDADNIFVFGGSTAFGYGVGDDETIPVALDRALRNEGCSETRVYNLARSNYYSSQERALFERLLVDGIAPRLALFLDGLNEAGHPDGGAKYSNRLSYLMAETHSQTARRALKWLPLGRLISRLRPDPDPASPIAAPAGTAQTVIARWAANRRLIEAAADAHGTEVLFVWQPVPTYRYDLRFHLFAERLAGKNWDLLDAIYGQMRDRHGDGGIGEPSEDSDRFLWLADLQTDRNEPLYVDSVHYTAAFSETIARALAKHIGATLCDSAP